MSELLGLLCILVLALAVVAVVGHGIWVGVAWLIGERRHNAQFSRRCPTCGAVVQSVDLSCRACGWPLPGVADRTDDALDALARQITRGQEAGLIDQQMFQRLMAAVREEQARRKAVSTPRPAAEPPPPVPSPEVPRPVVTPAPTADAGIPALSTPPPAPPAEPAARAREFVARRAEAAAVEEATPPEESKPSQPFTQLLSAFMEERNIRWGELVGGLLIVCGSIALVLSFWAQIAQRPFLKFFVFNGVTAGLFGLGCYADRRMKLPTTSQGLLIIATLLVPLNFLALAAFTEATPASDVVTIAGELLSIGLFAWLTKLAGETIARHGPWRLTFGVLGPSVVALLVRRFVDPASTAPVLYGIGVLPLACYFAATGGMLWQVRHRNEIGEDDANELFRLLGLTTFAALLPLGLLVFRTQNVPGTLRELAPLVSLAAAPALATGLMLWRRVTDSELVSIRTTGTAIAVCGTLVLLIGIVLAWPKPAVMVPVAFVDFVVLTAIAWLFQIPAAHLLATPCLVLAYLVGFHVAAGHVGWQVDDPAQMTGAMLSATSGTSLTPIALILAAASGVWLRRGRRLDAMFYAMVAGAAAVLSLVLLTWYGFGRAGDPAGATWVYALYAVGTLAAGKWIRHEALVWAASGLLLATLVQGIVFGLTQRMEIAQPWLWALLLHATVMLIVAIVFKRQLRADALRGSAAITSLVAAGLLVWAIGIEPAWFISLHALWISAIWLVLAWLNRSAALFTAFQVALSTSLVFAIAAVMWRQPWSGPLHHPWLDPWMLQAQGIALTLLSLGWCLVRIVLRRVEEPAWSATTKELLHPPWPTCDRVVTAIVFVLFVVLASYAAVPGAAQELSPRALAASLESQAATARVVPAAGHFELWGLPHEHALGIGSWLFLILLLATLVVGQWEHFASHRLLAAVVVLAMVCPLLAGRWESDVAVASAMRWYTAGFLAVASVAIWFRRPLLQWLQRLGWPGMEQLRSDFGSQLTTLALALAIAPLVAMALFVSVSAVAHYPVDSAVASTMRVLALVFAIAAAAGLVLRSTASGWFGDGLRLEQGNADPAKQSSTLLFILGGGPLLAVTLYVVSAALKGNPIVGPEPESFFHAIGLAASYALPVTLLALTLVGYAVRERSSGFAFAAGLLFNLSATMAYLFLAAKSGLKLDQTLWVKIGQLNATVSAGYALAWSTVMTLFVPAREDETRSAPRLLITQTLLGVAINLLLIVPGVIGLFLDPFPSMAHLALAGPLGWAGVLLATVSLLILTRAARTTLGVGTMCIGLVLIGSQLAFAVCPWDRGNWLGYHAMMLAYAAAGWLLLAGAWLVQQRWQLGPTTRDAVRLWVSLLGTLTVVFALREVVGFRHPWWAIGAMAGMSLLATWLACWSPGRGFFYIAAMLINLCATVGWFHESPGAWSRFNEFLVELLAVNAIAAALPVIAWLLLELRLLRPAEEQPTDITAAASYRVGLGVHQVAAVLAILGVGAVVTLGLLADAAGWPLASNLWLGWAALAATVLAAAACLWDDRARAPVAGLYVLGLVAVGMTLDQFDLPPRMIAWTGTMILAAYAIATSYLWSRRRGLVDIASRLGVPSDTDKPFASLAWLVPANGLLTVVVLAAAYAMVLTFAEQTLRLALGKAAVLQAVAIGLLARGERRSPLQYAALVVGVIGAVAWGWAWLDPGTAAGSLINRTVVVTVVLGAMTALYGLGPGKLFPRQTEWTRAAGRLVPVLAGLGLVSILTVLGIETLDFLTRGEVRLATPAIAAVAATLLGLAAAALIAAVVPGRDPLGLSQRGRTAYVYAAELFLALLFFHIRLTMPWLFRGFFTRYWPFIVVFIAFVGVGLSELFRRQKRLVLAEPLERTGALLPLLPLLGFWVARPHGHYSVLLLMVGALYALLSVTRRSFGFGVLAALAANGGLWYYLQQVDGYGFLEHPQVWLIPVSVCVLAAAYLNRDELSDAQMTTVRYLTSITIYVSSTADIFIVGVAHNPWLTLVLGGLSIAGIFLGILLRVRAFLFLGTAFLVLALFTIIWYAAVDLHQTWLIWLTVVIVGVAIIALFALFEKKRHDVLRVVEDLKEWDP